MRVSLGKRSHVSVQPMDLAVNRPRRLLTTFALVLAIPIVPFLLLHDSINDWVENQIAHPPSSWLTATLVFSLLASDVFLPIPSSVVTTLAGGLLPIPIATFVSWMGMNGGAIIGFALARYCGRAFLDRRISREDRQVVEGRNSVRMAWMIAALRAVPVLAEASVLLVGTYGMKWKSFLPPLVLSNLGISFAYTALGRTAANHDWLPAVLGATAALPLLLTSAARSALRRSPPTDSLQR
jgi:uncharacterized membrane protein YdjX (TVP38/TMEM64 family)